MLIGIVFVFKKIIFLKARFIVTNIRFFYIVNIFVIVSEMTDKNCRICELEYLITGGKIG